MHDDILAKVPNFEDWLRKPSRGQTYYYFETCTLFYLTLPHSIILYSILLDSTSLDFTSLHLSVMWSTWLCFPLLNFNLLYFTWLCFTVSYITLLCFTLLHLISARSSPPSDLSQVTSRFSVNVILNPDCLGSLAGVIILGYTQFQ